MKKMNNESKDSETVATKSINDGGNAFPLNYGQDDRGMPNCHDGMTLRDYFAAKAPVEIPGWFMKEPDFKKGDSYEQFDERRREWESNPYQANRYFAWRYWYADQMIVERQKGGQNA